MPKAWIAVYIQISVTVTALVDQLTSRYMSPTPTQQSLLKLRIYILIFINTYI